MYTDNPHAPTPPLLLSAQGRARLLAVYRDGLLHDTLPFWLPRAVDEEYGGYLLFRDRDGSLLDTDKGVWQHGRFAWLLATLHSQVEARPEWLRLSRHGIDFLRAHGFDSDGRMYFHLTREGHPLRKRRYIFSETFMVAALAAYGKAAGDAQAVQEAVDLFGLIIRYLTTPGLLPPKVNPAVRPSKGLAIPMILIVTAQILRESVDDPTPYTEQIDRCIAEIERDFMKPELAAVLESVGPNGEFSDHFDGRLLNPGHAIEAAWFVLHEAKVRGRDERLIRLGTTILDWMWRWGWDEEYGGIIYYRDVKGLPVQEYWHDMKFWWPQNEAIIATLLAYQLTGDAKYARWHQMIHDWAYRHFPDPEYGEWFGYLHRDGRLSTTLKGNLWKGPFHMPRMQLVCWQILEEMRREENL
ncbi:MAG: N-acylglucosamine 2-epimerase [Chloroflexi bacterium]|nr:MAG: N-acylglucosamine 2-epimerase [Chloroflexota bacterium]